MGFGKLGLKIERYNEWIEKENDVKIREEFWHSTKRNDGEKGCATVSFQIGDVHDFSC